MTTNTPKTNTAAYNGHAELLSLAKKMETALRKISEGDESDPHALSRGRRDLSRDELIQIASQAINET